MFAKVYQTGETGVEIFSPSGSSDPLKVFQTSQESTSQVKKLYDRSIKGYIVTLDTESTVTRLVCPNKSFSTLQVTQPLLSLQLMLTREKAFSLEIAVLDRAHQRKRFHFSSHFTHLKDKDSTSSSSPSVKLPWPRENGWATYVIDLSALCERCFTGYSFHSVDSFTLHPVCQLRKIFSLPISKLSSADHIAGVGGGGTVDIPSTFDFPVGTDAGLILYDPLHTEEAIKVSAAATPAMSVISIQGKAVPNTSSSTSANTAPSLSQKVRMKLKSRQSSLQQKQGAKSSSISDTGSQTRSNAEKKEQEKEKSERSTSEEITMALEGALQRETETGRSNRTMKGTEEEDEEGEKERLQEEDDDHDQDDKGRTIGSGTDMTHSRYSYDGSSRFASRSKSTMENNDEHEDEHEEQGGGPGAARDLGSVGKGGAPLTFSGEKFLQHLVVSSPHVHHDPYDAPVSSSQRGARGAELRKERREEEKDRESEEELMKEKWANLNENMKWRDEEDEDDVYGVVGKGGAYEKQMLDIRASLSSSLNHRGEVEVEVEEEEEDEMGRRHEDIADDDFTFPRAKILDGGESQSEGEVEVEVEGIGGVEVEVEVEEEEEEEEELEWRERMEGVQEKHDHDQNHGEEEEEVEGENNLVVGDDGVLEGVNDSRFEEVQHSYTRLLEEVDIWSSTEKRHKHQQFHTYLTALQQLEASFLHVYGRADFDEMIGEFVL